GAAPASAPPRRAGSGRVPRPSMVDLGASHRRRRQRDVSGEEEGNRNPPPADQLHRYGLAPTRGCRGDLDRDPARIDARGAQRKRDPRPDEGIVLAALAGGAGARGGSRFLADPEVDQATELDDAEEHREQHEGNGQDGLQALLPAPPLPPHPAP